MADIHEVVVQAILTIPGSKKETSGGIMICCPFHSDNTPSCGINLNKGTELPFGFFNCLGCGEKGGWNKLAKHVGLPTFKDWELSFEGNGATRAQKKRKSEAEMLVISEKERMFIAAGTKTMIPWPKKQKWRGVGGTILHKLEAFMTGDRDEVNLFFPIYVNGAFQGGVTAPMEKRKNSLSYVNTPGRWVKTSGLLGFDYVKRVASSMKKKKRCFRSIVLVEGPRDVTRLLENQIPALAVLGSENFTRDKLIRVMSLYEMDVIYVMSDNDRAGRKLYKTIKAFGKEFIKVKRLALPMDYDDDGNLIKLDPNNAPQDIIDAVKEIVYDTIR